MGYAIHDILRNNIDVHSRDNNININEFYNIKNKK